MREVNKYETKESKIGQTRVEIQYQADHVFEGMNNEESSTIENIEKVQDDDRHGELNTRNSSKVGNTCNGEEQHCK